MGKIPLVIFSNTSSDLEGVFGFLLEVGGTVANLCAEFSPHKWQSSEFLCAWCPSDRVQG